MYARLTVGPDGATGLEDYDRAMLWALRCVAAGRLDCPSLRRAFVDLCGRTADQMLCGLLVLVRLLAERSPDGLRLHLPGSSVMSRDERAILTALAALRDECGADTAVSGLADHLGGSADGQLRGAVRYLAELMAGDAAASRPAPIHTVH